MKTLEKDIDAEARIGIILGVVMDILSILISIAFCVATFFAVSAVPMLTGVAVLGISIFVMIIGQIVVRSIFKAVCYSGRTWLTSTSLITLIISAFICGITILVAFMEVLLFYSHVTEATKPAVAVIRDVVVSEDSRYLVLDYTPEETEEIQRVSLTVSGNVTYLDGEKVNIRYSPNNYGIVISDKLTLDSPIAKLGGTGSNPSYYVGE